MKARGKSSIARTPFIPGFLHRQNVLALGLCVSAQPSRDMVTFEPIVQHQSSLERSEVLKESIKLPM